MARISMSSRIFSWVNNPEIENSADPMMNLPDMVFGLLEEEDHGSLDSNSTAGYSKNDGVDHEDEERENSGSVEERKSFWESHHELLQATLSRTSSLESRIRNATKEAIKEIKMAENVCVCRRSFVNVCQNCLMREVCSRLQAAGFNSAICNSKWRSSPDIPSGEHTFLDVIDNSNTKKREVRVIIDLNFQSEFEMARANSEYNSLISTLPKIYVRKIERLPSVIKILCSGAKKCMKENKMHMPPWRKLRYMQAKWLRTCERTTSTLKLSTTGYLSRPVRPRASMLTVDLREDLSNLHRATVEVV